MVWAPDYITDAELKNYVRIDDTADDAQIALAITAASRAIDRHTNRQFGLVDPAEARTYTARYDKRRCRWVIDIDDLMTTTDLVVTTEAGTIDVVTKHPSNAAAKGMPWTSLVVQPESAVQPTSEEDGVTAVGKWGWAVVPEAVEQATALQASRFLARRNAPFGVAGSPELGSEMRLLAKVDPDVAVALGGYQRWWAAA